MKRKFTAVLLCVALLLTVTLSVSADTLIDETQTATSTQTTPVTNEITVNVGEDGAALITEPTTEPILPVDGGISPAATATPIGHLDSVTSSAIGGWAYQSDIPNTALNVHIYIINNSTGEQKIIGVTAGGYRADLKNAGYGNGYHAFHYNISWMKYKPGTYTVRAYAIGVNSSNVHLSSSPKTFTVRNMTGSLDGLGSTGISGWAWKPDTPNEAVGVHAHIIQGNTVLEVKTTYANIYRSDLVAAGYGNGYHGFSIPIDWTQYPEERLRLIVYMYDGSGHSPVLYNGYYNNGNGTTPTPTPTTAYIWPTVSKRITQMYNSIPPYTTGHYGIDIGAITRGVAGDPIYCVMDGYVVRNIPLKSTYGYGAYINHINPDQSISTYLQTRYAHMMSTSSVVVYTNITKGTVIGYMGNTGESKEVHLHFETRITPIYERLFSEDKSYCINPLTYYDSNGNVLAYNANSNDSSDNPWGLIFDINDIEIDRYGEVEKIDIEEPISP